MTVSEAAKKWHCTEYMALKAVRSGTVAGAAKVSSRYGPRWDVPEDAPCPIASFDGTKTPGMLPSYADISDPVKFVRLNANTESIRYLARQLGVSTGQVRSIYDQVLKEGGGSFDAD